jgi:hypothetical protein
MTVAARLLHSIIIITTITTVQEGTLLSGRSRCQLIGVHHICSRWSGEAACAGAVT